MNLEQVVTLTAGVNYTFHADLAMVPHGFNADGGTVSAYIGSTLLASYSFGFVTSVTQVKYGSLDTNYIATTSDPRTLSIRFSRGYGEDGGTPSDYIDNISLLAPLPPSLNIQLQGHNAVLTWTNAAYSLLAAPSLTGPYTNVPSATSPYTNVISSPAGYFRLLGN
jgi:hypothetical protein